MRAYHPHSVRRDPPATWQAIVAGWLPVFTLWIAILAVDAPLIATALAVAILASALIVRRARANGGALSLPGTEHRLRVSVSAPDDTTGYRLAVELARREGRRSGPA